VNIPWSARPLFTGSPHGDEANEKVTAISLVQVFEYEKNSREDLKIVGKSGVPNPIDLTPQDDPKTVNIHRWAQLEDETGISDEMADRHAHDATHAVKGLFHGLNLEGGARSLSVDDAHEVQRPIPLGIRYPELMTLAERFQMLPSKTDHKMFCSARTCGHGGTLYIGAP
jgi:hypothetical protein